MDFDDALRDLGFVFSRSGRAGRTYERAATGHLTYYVQEGDEGLLFTWEFAIGEFMAAYGLQVGSDEHLNTFLFPREDVRGPRDGAWVAEQMDRVEERLRSLSLLDEPPGG